MEEQFKKYIEKAKSAVMTADLQQKPRGAPEVSALKTQLQDQNQTLINLRRSAHCYRKGLRSYRKELLEVRAGNETLISDLKKAL